MADTVTNATATVARTSILISGAGPAAVRTVDAAFAAALAHTLRLSPQQVPGSRRGGPGLG